ncbi:MAG: hypothetical protein AAGM67_14955, partial [Bacteroidota bacterium]
SDLGLLPAVIGRESDFMVSLQEEVESLRIRSENEGAAAEDIEPPLEEYDDQQSRRSLMSTAISSVFSALSNPDMDVGVTERSVNKRDHSEYLASNRVGLRQRMKRSDP